jgi:transcriptional regulator with XRE-family HTH domain
LATLHPFIKFRNKHKPPMTQSELARRLGVTRSCINRIENGNRQVGIELLPKAVAETGATPAELRPDLRGVLRQ